MGIPYLLQFLSPHATPFYYNTITEEDPQKIVGHSESAPKRKPLENAIIDGPALAYDAYSEALRQRREASNALDATPKYSEINAVALGYLENLEKHGFRIAAIFFDGFLPIAKKETRFERLAANIKDLKAFKKTHSSLVEPAKADPQQASPERTYTFSTNSDTPAKLKSLPVMALMVPSIIEAISQSQFGRKTHVVSGEADEYCASFAKEYGGSIFTSDSDLLAYDLGESGAVIVFKETEIGVVKTGTQFRVKKYKTAHIARKLGLNSLQPLAYAIQEDHYRGLGPCLQHARALSSHPTRDFEAFLKRYSLPEQSKIGTDQRMKYALEQLDPRISEWVTQALIQKSLPHSPEIKHISFDSFMPFLIDDPDKSSAWRTGAHVRTLAYSIMYPSHVKLYTTIEYARKGPRITGQDVDHLSPSAIEGVLAEWCRRWDMMSKESNGVICWRLMGLHSLCQRLLQSENPLPNRHSMYALLRGKTIGPDWEYLHISAHFQAALYSWRMFYQVLSVLLVIPEDHAIMEGIDMKSLKQFRKSLPDIPQIQELFTVTEGIEDEQLGMYISMIYQLLDVQEDVSSPAAEEINKSRRKKRKEKYQDSPNAKPKSSTPFSSSNMYDLLSSTE